MSINANEETAATQPVPKSGDEAAPADPNVILKISDLSKDFEIRSDKLGEKSQYLHALSRVNLEVYKGETLGIIGESGCGKSTLGRCLVRLHEPTSGTVTFEGEPLDFKKDRARRQRRSVQMIFQDPYSSLNPRKTCAKIIEEPMIIHKTETDPKKREARVRKLMELVGLDTQHMHRYPHEFSGGQRQRINIARALSLGPKLLVCDEPVSALDVSIQAQVLNLFGRLQRELGLTYVFISHDLSVIKHISDRIALKRNIRFMVFLLQRVFQHILPVRLVNFNVDFIYRIILKDMLRVGILPVRRNCPADGAIRRHTEHNHQQPRKQNCFIFF